MLWMRGPDGEGTWLSKDETIGLTHRRLAIINPTTAGSQPMSTPDGSLRIVYNGEIYNYKELRRDIKSRGCRFFSNSDTEVILHLYREEVRNQYDGCVGCLHLPCGMRASAVFYLPETRLGSNRYIMG